MQASGVQRHRVEPAGIYHHLLEASMLNDAAETEMHRVTAPPLAPAKERPLEAPQATREAGYTAMIEALVIAALHALEAYVWDVQKRGAFFQDRVGEVAKPSIVTWRHQGTMPGDHHAPLCRSPRPISS